MRLLDFQSGWSALDPQWSDVASWQWEPSVWEHDPVPPIPLEDPITGAGAAAFDGMTVAAAGTPEVTGALAVALDAMTVAGSGTPEVTGAGSTSFADMSVAAAGRVGGDPPTAHRRPPGIWGRRI